MKKLLILLIFLFNGTIFSQSSDDIGKIALHVVMPEANSSYFENMGFKELKKVKSKIGLRFDKNKMKIRFTKVDKQDLD